MRRASLRTIDLAKPAAVTESTLKHVLSRGGAGFFYLAMSSKEQAAAARVMEHAKWLFALEQDIKASLSNDESTWYRYNNWLIPGSGPGYRGVSEDPNFTADARESFNIGRDTRMDGDAAPHGPNKS